MKHTFLLMLAAALLAHARTAFAQKPVEPAPEAPAISGLAPTPSPSSGSSRSRRSTSSASVNAAGGSLGTTVFSSSKGDSIPPVMIRFSQPDAKASAGLEEDLFVMARVISRTLERAEGDKVNYKLGVPMLLTGSGRSVRPMYIEGLGPLFMIKVNFALLPPPKAEEKITRKKVADTEWDDAYDEVFAAADAWVDEPDRGSSYNDEQVELLKKELLGTLKSAANMRGLKPDEFVNIAVFGHAPPLRIKSYSYPKTGDVGIGLPAASVLYERGGAAARGSVLTMRAKKSDIDAFADGKLDADGFKAKVTTTTYAGSGIGITSINSWIQENAGRIR